MYGINEVYLISHALLETGNGTSQLAKGADVVNNKVVTNSNTKYHNVFGIAAYDNDPLREGIKYAKQAGWDTVSKAIVGGAKFIGNSYVKNWSKYALQNEMESCIRNTPICYRCRLG